MDWQEQVKVIDDYIRKGQFKEAKKKLQSLPQKKIPRSYIWQIANLARRLNMNSWGLKLIRPFLDLTNPLIEAEAREVEIYSALLIKLGVTDEAIFRLDQLNYKSAQAKIFLAYAYVSQWDYKKAIFHLESIKPSSSELSPYQEAIAEVNLAASYVAVEYWAKARKLLSALEKKCRQHNWNLLLSNTWDLIGVMFLEIGDYKQARIAFNKSLDTVKGTGSTRYKFFNQKWKVVLKLKEQGATHENLALLEKLRQTAYSIKSWETLRDCDYYEVELTQNVKLAQKLFYTTPYASFRKKIIKALPGFSPKSTCTLSFLDPPDSHLNSSYLSLLDGSDRSGEPLIQSKYIAFGLLQKLMKDLYKPQPIGAIFSDVYPGEFYNPITTPQRISKALGHTRKVLKNVQLPINILVAQGSYKVEFTEPIDILFPIDFSRKLAPLNKENVRITQLKKAWSGRSFSTAQAGIALGLSQRSVSRLLITSIRKGELQVFGKGKNTRYCFLKAS